MPLDTTTPRRSAGTSGGPASAHASRAATIANCSHRSRRRAWTRSRRSAGSAAAHAAIRAGRPAAQSSVSAVTPLRPARSESQVDAASVPTGVIAPMPVTTTSARLLLTAVSSCRRIERPAGFCGPGPAAARPACGESGRDCRALDVLDDVLDCLQVLELVVGDLDAELLLRRDRYLHHRQRVDVQVVHEGLLGSYLVGGNSCHLIDDLAEAREDFLVCHGHLVVLSFLCRCGPLPAGQAGAVRGQGTVITWAA